MTGLRRKEQASLTIRQLHLDGPCPHAELAGKDSKSGKGAAVPLRADVVEELRAFLADRLAAHQRRTLAEGRSTFPQELPFDTLAFENPPTIRVFNRDLLAAGLARLDDEGNVVKTDDRGRTLDLHALRHTFGTHLSKAGVPPRTAQAAMRHSRIDLTMNVYTDPRLLDVAGAVAALPDFTKRPTFEQAETAKTGTFDVREGHQELAPDLVPDLVRKAVHERREGQAVSKCPARPEGAEGAQVLTGRETRQPRATPDRGCQKRATRFELVTFTLAT